MNPQARHSILTSDQGLVMNCTNSPMGGRIGLIRCPGATGYLTEDLQWLVSQHASVLLSLITAQELSSMGLSDLGAQARQAGLTWHHLPISDMRVPTQAFVSDWDALVETLVTRLADEEMIVMHCRAGLGRAGTISACLLVRCGVEPNDAITQIRHTRPGAIETLSQERWVQSQKG